MARAIPDFPVRNSYDGDVNEEGDTCCQCTNYDDSKPTRGSIEEGEQFVAETRVGVEGAVAVGVFDLGLRISRLTEGG